MNPKTNEFEPLDRGLASSDLKKAQKGYQDAATGLIKQQKMAALVIEPDKSFQPIWNVGDKVEVQGYFFEVMDIGIDRVILQPIGAYLLGEDKKP